ncbi:TPA: YhcH/YjgK/YiaL family protein [Candidatus Delongbacteria bacterium]|uniref:Beta-galactosidase subunit beta n=1 Tax=Candidatus Uhrbacteria bacterium GW2011_GWF2_39_13 TaxID=1618995 RepID=A0A0G0MHC2_9BACT|nr:MAG: Beta-galactosidase subunit beta [Candidatus Uhrbacteria bacterium GW2011_GWF2_39_13]HAQ61957.1 YhcH/YjgK/YiaL family protein [Candidatus Delongbacteria bacterium]
MIFDYIKNMDKYKNLNPRFEKAFAFIQTADLENLPVGKHMIEGDDIYASVTKYKTKTEGYLEAHVKYIDIQLITKGIEQIGFFGLEDQEIRDHYDDEKDIAFYFGDCEHLILQPGLFAIFFPKDLHKPGISVYSPVEVKKIVVKVRV